MRGMEYEVCPHTTFSHTLKCRASWSQKCGLCRASCPISRESYTKGVQGRNNSEDRWNIFHR